MSEKISVLRFKRKQPNDSPFSLVVQAKKPKIDGLDDNQHIIFKYAGRVNSDCEIESTLKKLAVPVVRKKRPLVKQETDENKNLSQKDSSRSSFRSVSVSKKRKIGEDIQLLEVDESPPAFEEQCASTDSSDLLTCNGLKLVRNKLNINEPSSSTACYNSDGDDLYDLYYHCWTTDELDTTFDPLDIIYVAPNNLEERISDSDENENFEDSDSNDEDHWKNDYPDSPDSVGSSDGGSVSSENSFSHNNRAYRNWKADGGIFVSHQDNMQYGFYNDDPTEFFERYSDHVQSDHSLSD